MTPITVTEADINLLLAEAAMIRSSYLGGDGEVLGDDEGCAYSQEYRKADRFDDLAEMLAPFCVPPLAEFAQDCADCDGDRQCNSCRGTGLWPPTGYDGVRLRLVERVA